MTAYVRYAIGLICLTQLVNQTDRSALSALMPMIKQDFALTDGQLGLLGLPFSLFYALCGIPIAWWADRGVRRDIIALAIAVWSMMTALSGAAQNYLQLLLARIGVGAGEAGSYAPGGSMLCDYVPLKQRTLTLTVFAFTNAAGGMAGLALAGWLGEIMGWRWTFVALGLPGLALALLVRLTLREPKRGAYDGHPASTQNRSLKATLGFLWRCRTYRRLVIFLVSNGFAINALYLWWPTFYTRLFGLGATAAGIYLGIIVGVCGGLGVLLGGLVASKFVPAVSSQPLRLSAMANAIALSVLLVSLFVPSASVSLILVSIATLLYACSNGPVLSAMYSVVPAETRATAGAVAAFLISGVGFAVGPLAVGLMSDALAPMLGQESLRYALLLPVAVFAITVIALLLAARTLVDDLQAVGALRAATTSSLEGVT